MPKHDDQDWPDENYATVAAGNEVNEVLLAHKGFWNNEDTQAMIDEVQDMCADAFVRGYRFSQELKANDQV